MFPLTNRIVSEIIFPVQSKLPLPFIVTFVSVTGPIGNDGNEISAMVKLLPFIVATKTNGLKAFVLSSTF